MKRALIASTLGALTMCGTVAAEELLPARILESEQSVIGEWTLSGRTGTAVWANGVAAELSIEQYDAERVTRFKRLDNEHYEASYAEKIGGASGFAASTTIAATGYWLRDRCGPSPH